MLTLVQFVRNRLDEKKKVTLEHYSDSGALTRATIVAMSRSTPNQAIITRGVLTYPINIFNVVDDRIAGTACHGRWCLSADDLNEFTKARKESLQPPPVGSQFIPLMSQLPGSAIAKVEKWNGIELDKVEAFLDVAHANDAMVATGYLLYKDGTLSGLLQAPDDARFEQVCP
jgi:hypothetical protein